MKKLKNCFIIVIVLILGIAVVSRYSYTIAFNRSWNISLPFGYSELYEKEGHFEDKRLCYHVIDYKYSTKMDRLVEWEEQEEYQLRAQQLLEQLEVSAKMEIPYERCKAWTETKEEEDELYIFLDTQELTLFIIELLQ